MTPNHWDSLVNNFKQFDLHKFREVNSINERLAGWSAIENSTRYYKALLYEFSLYLDELISRKNKENSLLKMIDKIHNINLGNPTTIDYLGREISLDYLLSIEECNFCEEKLRASKNICEIGAGFGRSCHSILSLFDVENYTIIDLPEMIGLSRKYLSAVLDADKFKKIKFLNANDYEKNGNIDFVLNVSSMQEMEPKHVLKYLDWISKNSKYFFTKNVIGKYKPEEINLKIKNSNEHKSVLEMGILKNFYPLYSGLHREKAVKDYQKAYCPKGFQLINEQRGFGQFYLFDLALFEIDK